MIVLLVLASGAYLLLASLVFGARLGDYSHRRDTLSELGAFGTPHQRAVSLGVFLPVALGLFVAACGARPQGLAASGLALSLSLGYLGAALFPCDPGAPLGGSRRQQLHTVAGAIEYAGSLSAMLALSAQRADPWLLLAAALVVVAILGLALPALARLRGLLQRMGEASAFAALACVLAA